jgi:LPS export ABC transporter protein LptC
MKPYLYPATVFKTLGSTLGLGVLILGMLSGCAPRITAIKDEIENAEPIDNLAFEDISLEEADTSGKPVWKLRARRATYQEQTQVAQVENPVGLIYQKGVETYGVEAAKGEIYGDGDRIVMQGQVTVRHIPENALLKGDQLEWLPAEDQLILRTNINGTYKDLVLKAQEIKFSGQSNQMTVSGQVQAVLKNSQLRFNTEAVSWVINEQRVKGDRPVQVEHFSETNPAEIIDRATALGLNVDLASQRSTLQPQAVVNLGKPAFDVRSDALTWDSRGNRVESNVPVTIVNRNDQTTITAQQGNMDLGSQVVTLTGNVTGFSPPQQANLSANQVIWQLASNQVQALGNVLYRKANPVLEIRGSQAMGRLNEETLVVTGEGGTKTQVKTVYVLD